MMKIAIILFVLCFQWSQISAEETQNKTKRGLLHQTHYLTSFRPVGLYAEPVPAQTQTQPQPHPQFYTPKIAASKPLYEPEPKVAAQQVVYEYQQTPTNTVSNVHFNQHIIPTPQSEQQIGYTHYVPQPANNNFPQVVNQEHFTPQDAVVNPVQHGAIIQHGSFINPTQIPQTNQNPYLLGKYLYLNGKVMYNANPQAQLQHPLAKPIQPIQKTFQKLNTPAPLTPFSFQSFQPAKLITTTTTVKPIVNQEVTLKKVVQVADNDDEEEEKANVREEEEDNDEEERGHYREEDDDDDDEDEHPKYRKEESYGRYRYDDDDDEDDHQHYKEDDDDDDEDSHRGSTKYYSKKEPKRYHTSYKYREGYKKESNSQKPTKIKESYKSVKSPKKYDSQGKASQHNPVTVQKVYKEKWYITRNSNPEQ